MSYADWLIVFQVVSIILGLVGAYMLAFGLKVKQLISDSGLEKELEEQLKDKIVPSQVKQNTCLFTWGLSMITAAAFIQFCLTFL